MDNIKIPTMLTINETAKVTNLPVNFIRQLVWDNKIVYTKAGNKYLVNLEKFIEYLNGDTQIDGNDKELTLDKLADDGNMYLTMFDLSEDSERAVCHCIRQLLTEWIDGGCIIHFLKLNELDKKRISYSKFACFNVSDDYAKQFIRTFKKDCDDEGIVIEENNIQYGCFYTESQNKK